MVGGREVLAGGEENEGDGTCKLNGDGECDRFIWSTVDSRFLVRFSKSSTFALSRSSSSRICNISVFSDGADGFSRGVISANAIIATLIVTNSTVISLLFTVTSLSIFARLRHLFAPPRCWREFPGHTSPAPARATHETGR